MRLRAGRGWQTAVALLVSLSVMALVPIAAFASPFTINVDFHSAGTATFTGDPINLNANVTSDTGSIVLNGNVTVGADVTLSAPLGVTINGTLNDFNAGHHLTIVSAGTTTFVGAVGNVNPLASIVMSGGGTAAVDGGSVTTVGNQQYQNLLLGADTTLTSSLSGLVTLSSVDRQGHALTVHSGPVPTVSSVSGCIDAGVSTTGCALGGGSTISVVGSGFRNTFSPTVNLGSNVVVIDDSHLTFTLAPGQADQLATVHVTTVGGTSVGTSATLRYAATQPTVASVSGCLDAGSSTQNCPTLGGVQLKIGGTGFSQGSPTVNVCVGAVVSSDTALTCTLVPGAPGSSSPVIVTTDGGPSTSNGVTVAYVMSDGGSGGDGSGVNPGATPELDSLLLFGFGATGLGGYAMTRLRARRRN